MHTYSHCVHRHNALHTRNGTCMRAYIYKHTEPQRQKFLSLPPHIADCTRSCVVPEAAAPRSRRSQDRAWNGYQKDEHANSKVIATTVKSDDRADILLKCVVQFQQLHPGMLISGIELEIGVQRCYRIHQLTLTPPDASLAFHSKLQLGDRHDDTTRCTHE